MKTQTFNLERFIEKHLTDYPGALNEIKNGRKIEHWMWYIFPQLRGLGSSHNSVLYGIEGIEEARAYLADPILESHLFTISHALLELNNKSVTEIFDCCDVKKLRSCMTLFAITDPDNEVYQAVLDKYFKGQLDDKTIRLLNLNVV